MLLVEHFPRGSWHDHELGKTVRRQVSQREALIAFEFRNFAQRLAEMRSARFFQGHVHRNL